MSQNPTSPAETVTVTVDGCRYRITREPGYQPGTVTERFPGIGLIGSTRAWRGHTWAKTAKWFAAVNPTGEPGGATAYADGFSTRLAAARWLVAAALDAQQRAEGHA